MIMKVTRTVSAVITVVFIVVFVSIFAYAIFFAESEPSEYDISYDNQKGIITIELKEAIPDGERYAYIYLTDHSRSPPTEDIIKHGHVSLSSDRMTITITDDSRALINLENGNYTIKLNPTDSSLKTLVYEFHVSNHEFSTMDYIGIGICITLAILIIAFFIIRRLARGRW